MLFSFNQRKSRNKCPPHYPYVSPLVHNPYHYPNFYYQRQFPPVNSAIFVQSAQNMKNLLHSANTIVENIATSPKLATNIMTAAQNSHQAEVEKCFSTLNLKNKPTLKYSPDGIIIQLQNNSSNEDCCELSLKIRWR